MPNAKVGKGQAVWKFVAIVDKVQSSAQDSTLGWLSNKLQVQKATLLGLRATLTRRLLPPHPGTLTSDVQWEKQRVLNLGWPSGSR